MIYVMSDIHGELELFRKMLEKIDLKWDDTLYILGDLIDRGEKSIETLQLAMNHSKIEFIIGNHEDMMLSLYTDDEKILKNWIRECNGGDVTLAQYNRLEEEEKLKIKSFLMNAALYKIVEVNERKFLLVHGGIRAMNEYDLEQAIPMQSRRDMIWIRDEFTKVPCRKDITVIFGHTFTQSICEEHKIWYSYIEEEEKQYNDKIGIDCGSYESKKLGCLRLDDMKEFYVESL